VNSFKNIKNAIPYLFATLALIPNVSVGLLVIFFALIVFSYFCQLVAGKFKIYNVLLLVFLLYLSITWVVGFSTSSYGRLFNFLVFFFSFIISMDFKYSASYVYYFAKYVLYLSIVMLLVQIYILIDNPLILYQVNYLDETEQPQFLGNTIYVMFLCFIAYLLCFIHEVKKVEKLIILSLVSIYVVLSGKATSLLLLFSLLTLTFVVKKGGAQKVFNLLVLMGSLFFIYKLDILPEFVSDRIQALTNFLFETGRSDSAYLERFDLMALSIDTFLKNPILGVGGDYVDFKGNFDLVYNSGIGHHSEFFDFLARFGLVGLFFLVFAVLSVFWKYWVRDFVFIVFSFIVFAWFVMNNAVTFEFAFLNLFTCLLLSNKQTS